MGTYASEWPSKAIERRPTEWRGKVGVEGILAWIVDEVREASKTNSRMRVGQKDFFTVVQSALS